MLELAVVIAVMGILSAVVIPSLAASYKMRLAGRVVADVTMVEDAAKWFFVLSDNGTHARCCRWPGQDLTTSESSTYGCMPAGARYACGDANGDRTGDCRGNALQELINAGFLNAGILTNPWGGGNSATPVGLTVAADAADRFSVSVTVPDELSNQIRAGLPGVTCVGPSSAGLTTCTSTIPRAGQEASIEAAMNDLKTTWLPRNVYNQSFLGGITVGANCGSATACSSAGVQCVQVCPPATSCEPVPRPRRFLTRYTSIEIDSVVGGAINTVVSQDIAPKSGQQNCCLCVDPVAGQYYAVPGSCLNTCP